MMKYGVIYRGFSIKNAIIIQNCVNCSWSTKLIRLAMWIANYLNRSY